MTTDDEDYQEEARRIDVELFLVHPTMDPDAISAALGLEAKFQHRVGEPRKTPKGVSRPGVYPDTRWRHTIRHEVKDQWFARQVSALVDRLVPHQAFFKELIASGGSATVIVQFLGDGYLGDEIPNATLAKMSELGVGFGIECFMVPQS